MSWKKYIKCILNPVRCGMLGICHHGKNTYFGVGVKVVKPKRCYFGNDVSIMPYTLLICLGENSCLMIGNRASIGMFTRITSNNCVKIGDNVLIGPGCFISDINHEYRDPNKPIMDQGDMVKRTNEIPNGGVFIGKDSWIGTNVVIAGTITIGEHSVIGANSVVTQNIPDYCVAVGVPCKVIKRFNFETNCWERVGRI